MLGYSEHAGQKGYIVRNLATGKIKAVAFNQVKFYENTIVYPSPPDYDIWLTKDIKRRDKSVMPPVSHVDMESDVSDDESGCDERVCSESKKGDDIIDNRGYFHEPDSLDSLVNTCDDDDDSDEVEIMESKSEIEEYDHHEHEDDADMMRRIELGEAVGPPPLSPPQTRERAAEGLAPRADEDDVDNNDDDENDEEDTDEERYEVASIDAWRRVGKKRNRYEFRTRWSTGETTWEPVHSFRDDDHGHIDVYNEYRARVDAGEIDEYKEGVSADEGESALDQEQSSANGESQGNSSLPPSPLDVTTLKAIVKRIEVLALIVKAGIKVPESRKKASISSEWPEFAAAETRELKSFYDLDV